MGIRLQSKIAEVLTGKQLTVSEITEHLKKDDSCKVSFTTNSVAQILTKKKQFEKCGFNSKKQVAIWRNKNVMDREIQTE